MTTFAHGENDDRLLIETTNDLSFPLFAKQMTNLDDREHMIESLSAIENTTKLLVNAFARQTNGDHHRQSLNEIHRRELIIQTKTFLVESRKLLGNLSKTLTLPEISCANKENLPESTINEPNVSTSSVSELSQDGEDRIESISAALSTSIMQRVSLFSVDQIIRNRLTPAHLLANFPLIRDSSQPNLATVVRLSRQTADLNDFMLGAYAKIINDEERICCNYDGILGKLPYPRHKRILLDLLIQLVLQERHATIDYDERRCLYALCEQFNWPEPQKIQYRGPKIEEETIDEQDFICTLFLRVIPSDDIKQILLAKQTKSHWNDNETCIYYARPVHLLWIKQQWLKQYPEKSKNEATNWAQCVDWAIDDFIAATKAEISSLKRKTMNGSTVSTMNKRAKMTLLIDEQFKKMNRMDSNVMEYATKLVHLIHNNNKTNMILPILEQLQLLERTIFRFYWTSDRNTTWSNVLDVIESIFSTTFISNNFRQTYFEQLIEMNRYDRIEIERLLQMT